MEQLEHEIIVFVLLMGVILLLIRLLKYGLKRISTPSIVGFILVGFLIKLIDARLGFLSSFILEVFQFLSIIGVFLLLFHVGLESNYKNLLDKIKSASVVWVGNVVCSGGLGFVVAYYLLGIDLIPSLFVASALTATSVAISVAVWEEADVLKTSSGELLVDSAVLDDMSGIVIMAFIFALAPILRDHASNSVLPTLAKSLGITLLKFAAFTAACVLFARYLERHITGFFKKLETQQWGTIIVIVGLGLIIASISELIGLSIVVGAFFAGLMFSRDPEAVKQETPFNILYELFTPFFFINLGLNIETGNLSTALGLGGVLLLIAVAGKVIGNTVPAVKFTSWSNALFLGVSMIPRAEVAMVIMQRGLELGDWAVSSEVYSSMVFVTITSALLTPVLLRLLLRRWRPT